MCGILVHELELESDRRMVGKSFFVIAGFSVFYLYFIYSLTQSAKEQREISKLKVLQTTWTHGSKYFILHQGATKILWFPSLSDKRQEEAQKCLSKTL